MVTTAEPLNQEQLSEALRRFQPGDDPIPTELRTSDRVLARVTDGIYRRPGSALRELISNAYDADATRVAINTDRPRFQRVTVSDDGLGMSPDVMAYLLHNIGGSAKRTELGSELGLTSGEDPTRSPGGRPLIGKIGIGLFSVAQLTQSFEISTKVRGANHSTVASVFLRQYSDTTAEIGEDGTYHAGRVMLWQVPAEDHDLHGTTITLTSVRPQTREVLQSRELWEKISAASSGDGKPPKPPLFHIGVTDREDAAEEKLSLLPDLPWDSPASPLEAFREFVNAPRRALRFGRRTPQYEDIFDEYLRMLWRLGLSAPLPYFARHPFDLAGDEGVLAFLATGRAGQEAESIELGPTDTLRSKLPFAAPHNPTGFSVAVDEIELRRPVLLDAPPRTSAAFQTPILFAGHYRTEYPKRDVELSAGPLEFTAYLYWTPKLIPSDHRGVLIRVNEASGTLFDPDFLAFPVNEQRRLGQITCEVFIHEGFDGALNIDRESFNHTHPHVTTVTRWVHNSLRQLIATQKRLSARAASSQRKVKARRAQKQIERIINDVWQSKGEGGDPPPVVLVPSKAAVDDADADTILLPSSLIAPLAGPNAEARRRQREEVVEALAQILAAYDFFDELLEEEQLDLIKSLFDVTQVYMP